MKIKCAWCGYTIEKSRDRQVSHGICPLCKKKLLDKEREDHEQTEDSPPPRKDDEAGEK